MIGGKQCKNNNGFFALDASTGNQLWSYPTSMRMATPFVVNGALYATCNITDVCVFALP
jgi:outer membrane protein assembly factor BamB